MRFTRTICLSVTIAWASSAQNPPSAKPKVDQTSVGANLGARVAFAGMITAAYQALGFHMVAEAVGPDKRILQLTSEMLPTGSMSSPLLSKRVFGAAMEVITDQDFLTMVKHSRFSVIKIGTMSTTLVVYDVSTGLFNGK
jgi:hypothetical protein